MNPLSTSYGYLPEGGRLPLPTYTLEVTPILVPMPGVRCKACEAKGQETWVIPGKVCHVCGAQCSLLKVDTDVPFQEDEELKPYL